MHRFKKTKHFKTQTHVANRVEECLHPTQLNAHTYLQTGKQLGWHGSPEETPLISQGTLRITHTRSRASCPRVAPGLIGSSPRSRISTITVVYRSRGLGVMASARSIHSADRAIGKQDVLLLPPPPPHPPAHVPVRSRCLQPD